MSRFRLYFDEDAMQTGLFNSLRARRLEVSTALECGMLNRSDEDHLAYAHSREAVLYSFNVKDYIRIHSQWVSEGKAHSGIIVAVQQRHSIGAQLKLLLDVWNRFSSEQMRSFLIHLPLRGS